MFNVAYPIERCFERFAQQFLALKKRMPSQVVAVFIEQIECEVGYALTDAPSLAFLQRPKVACAIFTQHNHLAVDDEMLCAQLCHLDCDRAVAFGPVVPAAAINRDLAVPQMELRSETIEFDLMH